MAGETEVKYLVLPDSTRPYLLARVRWPDVAEAISVARPEWQEDLGLFDLPYDPSSTAVTVDRAEAIAAGWGARLPTESAVRPPGPTLIRRMPANWSELTPAEKRAWSLELVSKQSRARATKAARAAKAAKPTVESSTRHGSHALPGTPTVRWRLFLQKLRHPLRTTRRGATAAVLREARPIGRFEGIARSEDTVIELRTINLTRASEAKEHERGLALVGSDEAQSSEPDPS